MNKKTWDILTLVLEQEPGKRDAKLKELCQHNTGLIEELTLLISNDDKVDTWWSANANFNDALLFDVSKELASQFPFEKEIIGQQFGSYTIVSSIGEGGMGKVFLAERSDGAFDRDVAIKVMSFNLNTATIQKQFFREQRILASLNHPGIAQLYDANVSEKGTPYLVMELVDGIDLISYAQQQQLSLDKKVAIFIKVCEAVEFAHKNLIVHRDLKPSNILVSTTGIPKVLDFGVSSWIQEISEVDYEQEKAFTLKYSPPEQINGTGFSTSTDIYSLGMLLFELLAEKPPFDFSGVHRKTVEKMVLEKKLPLLSVQAGNNTLNRDLDAIVAKATQKKEDLRYQTIQGLIQDLQNFRNHAPISARKIRAYERSLKLWKRNPASTTLGIVLGVGVILFSAFYNIQINKEREFAELEAEKATLAKEYLLDLFKSADPLNSPGEKQTVEDFLSKSINDLSGLDNEPELKEEASYTLAQVSLNLGAYAQAESLFVESYKINKELNSVSTTSQANALDKIGSIYVQLANYKIAKNFFDSALAIKRQLLNPNSDAVATSYSMIGSTLAHLGNLDSAEVLLEKSITIYSSNNTLEPKYLISNIESVADLSREQKDFERSARLLEENIILRLKYLPEDKRGLALSYNNLGFSFRSLELYEEAEQAYKSSIKILEQVFGDAHPNTLTTLSNLAGVYSVSGKVSLAEDILLERLQRVKEAFGENHWRIGQAYAGIATFHYNNDKFQKSSDNYKIAASIYEETLGAAHFWTNRSKLHLAISEVLTGQVSDGERLFLDTLAEIRKNLENRLIYYNYSSIQVMYKNLTSHDDLDVLSTALSDFLEWHDATFPA